MLAAVIALAGQDARAAQGRTPSLGVVVAYLTPESAPVYGVADGFGALVVGMMPGGSAAAGGVAVGDVIRALAGTAVSDPSALVAVARRLRVGGRTQIVVRRGGSDRTLALIVGSMAGPDPDQSGQVFTERYMQAVAAFEGNDSAGALAIVTELSQRGHAPAQNLRGVMIALGLAEGGDPAAAWWYRLAAHQGERSAESNLAWRYWEGAGVPRDNARAYYWMSLAAAGGEPDAVAARDQIAVALQPAELAAAQSWLAWAPAQAGSLPPVGAAPSPPQAPAAAATPPPAGPSRDEVRTAQRELARLGYDAGAADGVAGRRTNAAIRAFQRDAGLPVDGKITPALLAALGSKPTPVPAVPSPTQPALAQPAGEATAPSTEGGLGELGFPSGDLEIQD